MIALRRIDPVGAAPLLAHHPVMVDAAANRRRDSQRVQLCGLVRAAHQTAYAMTRSLQAARNGTADETAGAGHENYHVLTLPRREALDCECRRARPSVNKSRLAAGKPLIQWRTPA